MSYKYRKMRAEKKRKERLKRERRQAPATSYSVSMSSRSGDYDTWYREQEERAAAEWYDFECESDNDKVNWAREGF